MGKQNLSTPQKMLKQLSKKTRLPGKVGLTGAGEFKKRYVKKRNRKVETRLKVHQGGNGGWGTEVRSQGSSSQKKIDYNQ